MNVVTPPEVDATYQPKKRLRRISILITFGEAYLEGMSQPHNDALVVTSRIGGFLVKRVMVDQGSGVEIMYLDLYKGLGLKPKDLSTYDTVLVGFDGKVLMPEGQIRLPVVTEGKEAEVNFMMVNAISPYTTILR